jgi:hypothetical protein
MNTLKRTLIAPVAVAVPLALCSSAIAHPAISIDKRSFIEHDSKGFVPNIYISTHQADEPMKGALSLKIGNRSLGTQSPTALDYNITDFFNQYKLTARDAKAAERHNRLRMTVVGEVTGLRSGESVRIHQSVIGRVAGKTKKYDGYYTGSTLNMLVQGGLVTGVAANINTYCSGSHQFITRELDQVDSYPAEVSRGGTFSAAGRHSSDSVKYRGQLTGKGRGKGYASLFHSEFGSDSDGQIVFDNCFGATNFTVKRKHR